MGNFSIPMLATMLQDKDDDVRKFAIDLIYDIQSCDYPDKLVELLKNDPNANVRAPAAKELSVLNYSQAVPQLILALNDDEWVCFSALEALTSLKNEIAVDPIVALLASPSETIRFAAIEALGKSGLSRSQHPLLEHMSRSEGFEKRAAMISLIQLGTIPASVNLSDDLIDLLVTGEWEDKFIAIKGVIMIKEERAIYHMIDIAGSIEFSVPDREEKVQVIKEAVMSFGCNETLLKLLDDDSMKYRGKSLKEPQDGGLPMLSCRIFQNASGS